MGVESISPEARSAVQGAGVETSRRFASVTTWQDFSASSEVVWEALLFYEEITACPPFFLRTLLPTPIRADGCKFEVGSEVKCRYVEGHLLKRVTQIIRARNYVFEVIEQNLALGGIKVLGGDYTLRELSQGRTRVALATRYTSPNQPGWLCGWFEAGICHSFHRYILGAMRKSLSPRQTIQRKQ